MIVTGYIVLGICYLTITGLLTGLIADWIEGCGGWGQGAEWVARFIQQIVVIRDACPAQAGRRSGTYSRWSCPRWRQWVPDLQPAFAGLRPG